MTPTELLCIDSSPKMPEIRSSKAPLVVMQEGNQWPIMKTVRMERKSGFSCIWEIDLLALED